MEESKEVVVDELYKYVNKRKVLIFLISLDFTYLNKKFGYEDTNKLKADIVSRLRKERFIFFKDLGSKLLFVFDTNTISGLMNEIDKEIVVSFLRSKGLDPAKLESRLILFTIKEFGDFDLSFENRFELFEEAYAVEKYLKGLRGKIQDALRKRNFDAAQKFQDECARLQQLRPTKTVDYSDMKRVMRDVRNSLYLTKAAAALFSGGKDLDVFYSNIVNYRFWLALQEILLEDFKKEKIYRFFNPAAIKTGPSDAVVKIDDLKLWYNSSIALFYPFLTSEQKKQAEEIKAFVDDQYRSRKETEAMVVKIYAFTKALDAKGHLNLPISNLEVSQESYQFQRRQFYLAFGKDRYQHKLDEWRTAGFAKPKFPLICDTPVEKFLRGFAFMNEDRFTVVPVGERLLLSVAFLEMDGFNAFNKYFFPTDSDKVYSRMINKVFEVANKYFMGYLEKGEFVDGKPDIFKSMVVYILGDEFFFAFMHSKTEDAAVIQKYLEEFRKEALKLVADVHFIKTEKQTVKLEENEIIVRHAVPVEDKSFFRKNEVDMELARLSFSGYAIFNREVIKEDYLLQLQDSLKKVEAGVDAIKNSGKGRLEFKRAS
ncbi:hypothetical protein HZB03_00605 [Candidatus Woesearchaeota archaeon]|nr:hypothetical protein [Candidatus Woesearchaeota archaeon]